MSSTETTIPKQTESSKYTYRSNVTIMDSNGSYHPSLPSVGTGHYGHYPFDYYSSSDDD